MTERERLIYIIAQEGLTSKQFSEKVGIGAGTISNITSGRNNASLDVLQRVRARFPKYNAQWLYEGLGDPLGSSAPVVELPLTVDPAPVQTVDPTPMQTVDPAPVQPVTPAPVQTEEPPVVPAAPPRTISKIVIFYSDGTFEER